MSLNESIVEDAALSWFEELGYSIGHGPHMAPGEPAAGSGGFFGSAELPVCGLEPAAGRRALEPGREHALDEPIYL